MLMVPANPQSISASPALPERASILLVEDDPVTRARIGSYIQSQADLLLAGSVSNAADAVQWLNDNTPDVLLVDLGLPDASGTEVIRYANRRHPNSESMVITVFGDEAHVLESIEAGATGYVLKDSTPEEIAQHIRQLLSGGSPISPAIARRLLVLQRKSAEQDDRLPSEPLPNSARVQLALTEREIDILGLIAKGFTAPEIARRNNLSTHTVATHIKSIYRKLAVHSRAEAVAEAQRFGIVARDRRKKNHDDGAAS